MMTWEEQRRIARLWAAYKILNCGATKFADYGFPNSDETAIISILEDFSSKAKLVESLEGKIKILFT